MSKSRYKMRMLRSVGLFAALLIGGAMSVQPAQAQTPEPAAVTLVSNFLQALQIGDEAQRVQAVLPYLHKSLLTASGTDLSPDVKRYQFKKASQAAASYAVPANVTRVHSRGSLVVDEGHNPEKGRVDDYYIAKKDGQSSTAAPVQIFFPEDGSAPKIFYMGSL